MDSVGDFVLPANSPSSCNLRGNILFKNPPQGVILAGVILFSVLQQFQLAGD